MLRLSNLGLAVILLSVFACDGVRFNRGSKGKDSGSSDAEAFSCGNEQFLKFKFPADIRNCIAPEDGSQGHIYDFPLDPKEKGKCTDVATSSFKCGLEELKGAVIALGMQEAAVLMDEAAKQGAILVACGEKNAGRTIVAQWYVAGNNKDCEYMPEKTQITTSCFKQYIGKAPPKPTTKEEKRIAVSNCMAEAN